MSDGEDIFAYNSSADSEYLSASNAQDPQESIVIEESDPEDDSEEDSEARLVIERMKKRQSRRMSFHPKRSSSSERESDDEPKRNETGEVSIASDDSTSDEERDVESRAFSPVTRMSITGLRATDITSDEDEEEVVVKKKSNKRNILLSDDESEEESEARDEKRDSFEDSLPLNSYNAESSRDKRDSISTKLSSTAISEDIQNNLADLSINNRLSNSVRESIGNKLSSTAVDESGEQKDGSGDSSSVALLEKTEEILSVSSDDEKPTKPMVQPTIRAAFAKQLVSQSFYDDRLRKLSDLKTTLVSIEKLTKTMKALPDKGAGLMRKMKSLKQEIEDLSNEVNKMEVNGSQGVRSEIRKSFESSVDTSGHILTETKNNSLASTNTSVKSVAEDKIINISWDDIQKATEQIQPKYTGKQGMATFETQKTLTMDRLATLHKSIATCPTEDTLADPPKLLKIELMNHQRHALAWMMWRESQKPRGGILADDMGLGKTLSMISLILKAAEMEDPDKEEDDSDDSDEENYPDSGWKAKGRKDYYAGGTLIVCPASLMRQWEGEIVNRVSRNSLAVNVYHGSNRDVKPRHLAKYDVVITTYNIVSREHKSSESGVFGVNWERLILDEAHMIRNHKSAMSVACCALKGRYRWVLTGTPIQNKEMDMYALLKFLRCTPFDDLMHWKKWIDNKNAGGMVRLNTIMKSIMLRRTKQQLQEKGSLQCLPEKNIALIEVKLDTDEMNVYQKVLLYSRTLFAQFLHQRAEKENDAYFGAQGNRPTFAQTRNPNGAYDRVHQKLKKLHAKEEVHQHQILVLLLRLRQICCHPGLIHQMLEDDDGNFDVSTVEEEPELDLLDQLNKLKLTDAPDGDDANDSSKALQELNLSDNLPKESEAITKASSKVMLRSNPVFDLGRLSSKIAKALELLDAKIMGTDDKAVVVSQWSSVLDIVADHLTAKRIRHVSLTGKVPVKFRNDIVVEFNKQGTGPKIMLLSLTAGGVGLNLVGANHLLLLDLHWNPQLEAQAQDRVYRVGQKKTVYIWKFMCSDTVEQAIRMLQEKKLGIADEVLTGTKHTGSKLSIDDLKALFGL
ncbi:transcription termination factor 2 [Toxorhynchites rutilus septentrionalis]|uniref:transcription termination factor 2 n=1 Tax=Toxorhynchites rutilus septentrionalis TaxID=329112 RepID=UPI002478DC4F|nr:transcription termination factor 2 [Toxorhynchites rutilus septentrionalis]